MDKEIVIGKRSFPVQVIEEEIDELTQVMLVSDDFAILREHLQSIGIKAESVLLAHFAQNEDSTEFGVIVTSDSRVFRYEQYQLDPNPDENYLKWREAEVSGKFLLDFPQINVALGMISGGGR